MTINHLTGHLGIMFDPSLVLRLRFFISISACMLSCLSHCTIFISQSHRSC